MRRRAKSTDDELKNKKTMKNQTLNSFNELPLLLLPGATVL